MNTSLERYLARFSEADWLSAVDSVSSDIHPVDRDATHLWFRFFPLELRRYVADAVDQSETVRELAIQGDFDLAEQIDTSHRFLFGHRFWKAVKAAVVAESVVFGDERPELTDEIRQLAANIAGKFKIDVSLLIGITAVGLMTLRQVGIDDFRSTEGDVEEPTGLMARSPDDIVAERNRDDSQGLLGFLRTVDKKFSIDWIDKSSSGKFKVINDEEIASASARDQSQDWRARDPRCWEGVVPVECRSASCGTCWIGVLGGHEKLSDVGPRERRMMKVFGYNQPEEEKPILRLACQARAYGNATVVIPSWNGVFGRKVYGNVEEVELEPVTTSAKKLREAVASVVSGDN
jgi:ferredoxin